MMDGMDGGAFLHQSGTCSFFGLQGLRVSGNGEEIIHSSQILGDMKLYY